MKMKIKSSAIRLIRLSIILAATFSFIGCTGTDHSNDVKTHEMGGPKPSYSMQNKDMPGRTN